MNGLDQVLATFREEAAERLAEVEAALLELESAPTDASVIDRIFRAIHTVKGGSGMVGLTPISTLAHEMETVFEQVRSGKLAVSRPLIDLSLGGTDLIRSMLAGPGSISPAERERIVAGLRGLDASAPATGRGAQAAAPEPLTLFDAPAAAGEGATYRIAFRPGRDLLRDGTNPLLLLRELRGLGTCALVADNSALPPLEDLDPESCYVSWEIVLSTKHGEDAIRDVFIFVADHCDLRIEKIADPGEAAPEKKLGEILLERGAVTQEQLREGLSSQKRIGEILEEKGYVAPVAVRAAAAEQQVARDVRAQKKAAPGEAAASIRVPAERLDNLVDLVGELVIAQARLFEIAGRHEDPALATVAEDIARLSADLRDNTLGIRMIPIGTTFGRFTRLVRDLAGELGKDIELGTDGADTELDKTVIERLGDPLVHLIRNCCDHGIEAPAARVAAGKPARGTVHLSAYHAGRSVVVEIHDDGAGLDGEALRAQAIRRGIIEPEARLSERETYALVFHPGLSTAKAVSNVSGRGVGMDVVKRSVEALRGSIEIESKRGVGTTIRITLPLTLAIIEGLLVAVGDAAYVLPMSVVEECVELTGSAESRAHGNNVTPVRGEQVPYLRLRDWFQVKGERPPIEQITIVTACGLRFGFVVDHVIGQHQTVIKALGNMYAGVVNGISGATILGDGTVALIVDVPTLLQMATSDKRAAA